MNLIGYTLLFLSLVYAYDSYIVPEWGYMGFTFHEDYWRFVQSLVITLILGLLVPAVLKNPSDILINIQFIFPILPMLVIYARSNQSLEYISFVIFLFLLIITLNKLKIDFLKIPKIKITKFSYQIIAISSCALVILTIVLIAFLTNLQFVNFNLLRVYEFRSQISTAIPGYFSYFYSISSKILIPTLIILCFHNKQYKILPFVFVLSILMFGLTSHKAVLFYPCISIFIYFFVRWKYPIQKIILSSILTILISLFMFHNEINNLIPSLLVRRVYFVPASLNYMYYDFFSKNPKTLFADSKITLGLIEYPYDVKGAKIVGSLIYPGSTANANTGWVGSGYMNLGYIGMFLYSIIISLLFKLLNNISNRIDSLSLTLSLVIVPFFTLFQSSDLLTTLLSHGLIFSFIIIMIIPSKRRNNEKPK
jgi:hypothetical protein